jgi:hypothetical protein
MAPPLQGRAAAALVVMSNRQLANESLTSQGIEIPRPDKPEELRPEPGKARGRQSKAASNELRGRACRRWVQASKACTSTETGHRPNGSPEGSGGPSRCKRLSRSANSSSLRWGGSASPPSTSSRRPSRRRLLQTTRPQLHLGQSQVCASLVSLALSSPSA